MSDGACTAVSEDGGCQIPLGTDAGGTGGSDRSGNGLIGDGARARNGEEESVCGVLAAWAIEPGDTGEPGSDDDDEVGGVGR